MDLTQINKIIDSISYYDHVQHNVHGDGKLIVEKYYAAIENYLKEEIFVNINQLLKVEFVNHSKVKIYNSSSNLYLFDFNIQNYNLNNNEDNIFFESNIQNVKINSLESIENLSIISNFLKNLTTKLNSITTSIISLKNKFRKELDKVAKEYEKSVEVRGDKAKIVSDMIMELCYKEHPKLTFTGELENNESLLTLPHRILSVEILDLDVATQTTKLKIINQHKEEFFTQNINYISANHFGYWLALKFYYGQVEGFSTNYAKLFEEKHPNRESLKVFKLDE